MNVGHPSNMARVVALYGGIMDEKGQITKEPDVKQMRQDIYAVSISDQQTKAVIRETYLKHQVILEPHGAAGWAGLQEYFNNNPADNKADQLAICLETAHPAKFPDEIRHLLNIEPVLPASMEGQDNLEESFEKLDNHYDRFKEFLLARYPIS
jgi:threonine synthase